jgi:hypothetical protein
MTKQTDRREEELFQRVAEIIEAARWAGRGGSGGRDSLHGSASELNGRRRAIAQR